MFNLTGGVLHAEEVGFDLLNRGGTLAPGEGIGRTHVAGNLTLEAGALEIELESGTGSDTLAVDGRLTLGGALDVKLLGGYRPKAGDRWLIADAGDITGGFTRITEGFRIERLGGRLFLFPSGRASG
jgi:hypothetical protein